MVRIGNFFFKYRNSVFPIALVVVVLLFRPQRLFGDPTYDFWLDIAGIAVAVLGDAIRVAVIGLDYIKRGGKGKEVYADDLVTGGIFAHSRNPLYVGNLTMIFGLALIFHHWAFYTICFGGAVFIYLCITAAEENFLRGKFGEEYEEYCRNVPRFFPRLSGLRATLRSMRFDWHRVLRKEYGTMYSLIIWVVLLTIWEEIMHQEFSSIWEIRILTMPILLSVAALCVGFVAWFAVRVMKKRSLLGAG